MNVIRIAALSVLLAASVAGAQSKKAKQEAQALQEAQEKSGQPIPTEKPKTCSDQCAFMEQMIGDSCKKGAGENKAAQKSCQDTAKNLSSACEGSCAEKGRIDKQYMMERLKPPSGGKLPKGAQQSSEAEGEGDAQ